MKYNIDDVLLCKVKKIEGTSVFLETEEGFPGSMILSEVAAGRIRNLRVYVSPNRMIVCKVLQVKKDHLELSLRRVTTRERQYVLENHKKEKAFASMLKLVGENPDKIIPLIKLDKNVSEFLDEARENVELLRKYVDKTNVERLFKLIGEKEEREKRVERRFLLSSDGEEGVREIREILNLENCEIHYLGSGRFSIGVEGKDFKDANQKMESLLKKIGERAIERKAEFVVEKEK